MEKEDKGKYFNNSNHLNDEGIALYIDSMLYERMNELPPYILQHVENCLECKGKIGTMYNILKENFDYSNIKHPYFERTHSDNKYLRDTLKFSIGKSVFIKIAVSITIIISLYIFYKLIIKGNINTHNSSYQQISDFGDSTWRNNDKDSALNLKSVSDNLPYRQNEKEIEFNETISENYISEHFTEFPALESAVNEITRDNDLTIIHTPEVGEIISQDRFVKFEWKTSKYALNKIKIINNKGEEIYSSKMLSSNSYLLNRKLSPGLYYWKLEEEDEVIYVGKFIIK